MDGDEINARIKDFEEKRNFMITREHNLISEERLSAFTEAASELISTLLDENAILRQRMEHSQVVKGAMEKNVFICLQCNKPLAFFHDYVGKNSVERVSYLKNIIYKDDGGGNQCSCESFHKDDDHYIEVPWSRMYFWDGQCKEDPENVKPQK